MPSDGLVNGGVMVFILSRPHEQAVGFKSANPRIVCKGNCNRMIRKPSLKVKEGGSPLKNLESSW